MNSPVDTAIGITQEQLSLEGYDGQSRCPHESDDEDAVQRWFPCPGCDRVVTHLVQRNYTQETNQFYSSTHCCMDCENGAGCGCCGDPWACAGVPSTFFRRLQLPEGGRVVHYLIHEPDAATTKGTPLPAVLFLHGSHTYLYPETLGWDMRNLVMENRVARERFIVIAPFAAIGEPLARLSKWTKLNRFWEEVPYVDGFDEERVWSTFMAALNVIGAERVDMSKLHVIGFSMGGQAAWNLAARHGSRLASALPLAGFCSWGEDAWSKQDEHFAELRRLPIWCYCSEADTRALSWRDFWWIASRRGLSTKPAKRTESHAPLGFELLVHEWGDHLRLDLVRGASSGHCIWNANLHEEDRFGLFSRMLSVRCDSPASSPQEALNEAAFSAGRDKAR
eukprot:TRINITY_DN57268_c0_g1_i1.p1 TRINITY_DN57268_c0_g1~~TRINITY_DN57268_c0_g1_i1.p1  ORF type:complete len:393 (-),score=48.00 TRINITY_DN57268_c0_g1_i1:16-1194(-)